MELPKMKIFIYALTFLGYAWSGYGSSMISNLRDAVLSAEKVFGDVFDNVITVAKQFRNVKDVLDAASDETCVFKCPSGLPGVPNKYHTPHSDGCGSYGISLTEYLASSDITECCNAHDICYDTCNSGKDKCDFEMQRCLYKLCETTTPSMTSACKGTAKIMFAGTFTLGCKAYLDSQGKACYCPADTRKPRHRFQTGGEL